MELEAFIEYLAKHSSAEELFWKKALTYLNDKNEHRERNKRWNERKIENEAEKMWNSFIESTYKNIAGKMKDYKSPLHGTDKWLEFMNEFEFLDQFSEGIDEIEFE